MRLLIFFLLLFNAGCYENVIGIRDEKGKILLEAIRESYFYSDSISIIRNLAVFPSEEINHIINLSDTLLNVPPPPPLSIKMSKSLLGKDIPDDAVLLDKSFYLDLNTEDRDAELRERYDELNLFSEPYIYNDSMSCVIEYFISPESYHRMTYVIHLLLKTDDKWKQVCANCIFTSYEEALEFYIKSHD